MRSPHTVSVDDIRIHRSNLRRLFNTHILDTLLGLEVPLNPVALTLVIPQTEGVASEAVHIHQCRRDSAITKEPGYLVQRLGTQGPEIPLYGSVT